MYQNDPEITELSFENMHMPESRLAGRIRRGGSGSLPPSQARVSLWSFLGHPSRTVLALPSALMSLVFVVTAKCMDRMDASNPAR